MECPGRVIFASCSCIPCLKFKGCAASPRPVSDFFAPLPLPVSSYIGFPVVRCIDPEVVWSSGCFSPEAATSASWCRPIDGPHQARFDTVHQLALADRYGGVGPGGAGGSGRCAILPGTSIQIKGCGVTPLVDPNADPFHRSGVMHLEEALQEVIFGEIFSRLLPYGAVGCLSLVLTGERYVEEGPYEERVPRRRALLHREFPIRPAHFLRNLRFVEQPPSEPDSSGLKPDVRRVVAAMAALPKIVCRPELISINETSGTGDSDVFLTWVSEFAKRLASQLAATEAIQLCHGSISCGNMTLDGRLLDYGLSGYVPFGRRHAKPPNWQDPTDQSFAVKLAIQGLVQQAKRYAPWGGGLAEADFHSILRSFDEELQQARSIEYSTLFGIDRPTAIACPSPVRDRLRDLLLTLANHGHNEKYVHFEASKATAGDNPAPLTSGQINIASVLQEIGVAIDGEVALENAIFAIPEARHSARSSILDLHRWIQSRFERSRTPTIQKFLGIQMIRRSSGAKFLHRRNLQPLAREIELNGTKEDANRFIQSTVANAIATLSASDSGFPGNSLEEKINNSNLAPSGE